MNPRNNQPQPFDNEDPRLTAYALGELELEEAREVRAAIAGDAAAQQYVQEVRAMAGLLRDELQAEAATSAGAMNDQQRSAVRAAAMHAGGPGGPGGPRRLVIGVSFALAAMVLLAAGMTLVLVMNQPAARRAATPPPTDEMYAMAEPVRQQADSSEATGGPQPVASGVTGESLQRSRAEPSAGEGQNIAFGDGHVVAAGPEEVQRLSEVKAKLGKELVVIESERLKSMDLGDGRDRDFSQLTQERGLSEGRSNFDAKPATEWSMPSQTELDRQLERRGEILRRTGRRDVATVPRVGEQLAQGGPPTDLYYRETHRFTAPARSGPATDSKRLPKLLTGDAVTGLVPATPKPADDPVMLGLRVAGAEVDVEDPASREQYLPIVDNAFARATAEPLSTFSIDVDTASYANVRRFLNEGVLPPRDAVRIEELLNYFTYDYAPPTGDQPFAAHVEVASAPWDASHKLVRIGIKGREMPAESRPPGNLVFLLDVSGSMKPADKLPLIKQGMTMLAAQLRPEDRVAIVTYAGDSRVALNSTSGDQHEAIQAAIDQLQAGGSTNGGAGIAQAYQIAVRHFVPGGVNRVILATDGDFNVGTTSMTALQNLIENKRETGVFLSVLGCGTGNLKDGTMEMLADKGNGNYAYIDNVREARKVLVEQMNSTLVTIAKDVKVQVEFNPALVESYRLIGYENRVLAAEDFSDDRKDAGEIGAGHTVTALYEIVPAKEMGKPAEQPAVAGVDPLRYRRALGAEFSDAAMSDELLTVKMRYKQPESAQSTLLEFPVKNNVKGWEQASADFKFAAAVAGFGMILRDSPHKGGATWPMVLELAAAGQGKDQAGWRSEFADLARTAKNIAERQ